MFIKRLYFRTFQAAGPNSLICGDENRNVYKASKSGDLSSSFTSHPPKGNLQNNS